MNCCYSATGAEVLLDYDAFRGELANTDLAIQSSISHFVVSLSKSWPLGGAGRGNGDRAVGR